MKINRDSLKARANNISKESNISSNVVYNRFFYDAFLSRLSKSQYKDNYVLKCVQKNDYLSFAKYEMKIRQTLKYPPYYYLVLISIKSKYYEEAIKEAKKVKEYLSNHVSSQTIILGPALSGTPMVNKIYHFEILTKYKKDDKIKPALKELDEIYLTNHKVQIDYDFYH